MAAAAVNSSLGTQKVCFNSNCKAVLERGNKGWRRRTGEFAELCDRCSSAYEAGNFCETFHLNSSGWRCCESCGKQIHCGCIVSFHMFVLLDPGGIECLTCARKSFILTPNPAWPPPSLFLPVQPERIKDMSTRNWPALVGSGPVPWRQAPSVFNATSVQSELQPRMPIEVDRHRFHERLSSPPVEKRKMEESLDRLMNGSLKISCSGVIGGGGAPVAKSVEQPSSSLNLFQQTANSKTLASTSALVTTSKPETDNHHSMVAGTTAPLPTVVYPQAEKRSSGQNQADESHTEKRTSGQNQADVSEAQPCNGKPRGDVRGRGQLLPRYWPRISEEELQKISENSNSVITPLFEKMLSASDAGRIGRLVLPKKCAEAYFPPISQPEGVPLKIQDLKGKEWVFQFRFWPNNNSRMYVLEGIMPCIQSMQLQAGDIVTFSRIEPEGKLVMGCRKASTEKGNETSSHKPPLNVEGMDKGKKVGESPGHVDAVASSPSLQMQPPNQLTIEPAASTLYEADKHGVVVVVGKANTSVRGKRKNSTVGLKRKRLRIDSEDAFELKASWEQVQGLLRPSTDKDATVFVVEGCEIEEFEEGAPVIGRPTIPESDRHGKKVQWVQCEKCLKWRKVPTDVLLKSQWTCSDNLWDSPRSWCSADEELTADKLEALLTTTGNDRFEKTKDPTPDPEIPDVLEGLDALAELAIQEKAASSSLLLSSPSPSQQPPTSSKHPRHKPGCSCIVCIQPPSGKGPKHKQPCDCVVCKSVKRRFETLMLKREQKLSSEKEPEPEPEPEPELESGRQSSEIDLNIRPDREEDRLAGGGGGGIIMNKEMQRMPKLSSSENIENSGKDWRFVVGGISTNKEEMQQTPKMSSEYTENSGEDRRLAGGEIMNKEMQQTLKMSPENIENSGEDRRLAGGGGGINTNKEMQPTPEMSPGEDIENSGAEETILENIREMLQRLPGFSNGIGDDSGDNIIISSNNNDNNRNSSPNGIVASVTPASNDGNNNHISSPNRIVAASVATPADCNNTISSSPNRIVVASVATQADCINNTISSSPNRIVVASVATPADSSNNTISSSPNGIVAASVATPADCSNNTISSSPNGIVAASVATPASGNNHISYVAPPPPVSNNNHISSPNSIVASSVTTPAIGDNHISSPNGIVAASVTPPAADRYGS